MLHRLMIFVFLFPIGLFAQDTILVNIDTLEKDTAISIKNFGQVTIPAGSIITYKGYDVKTIWLPKQVKYKDYTLAPQTYIVLYPTGEIKQFTPQYPVKVRIKKRYIPIRANKPLSFYVSGKIKEIYLSQDFILSYDDNEVVFKAGTPLRFYENGQVEMGMIKYPTEVKVQGITIVLRPNRPIRFYSSGQVRSGFLHLPAQLTNSAGELCGIEKGRYVEFDSRGFIKCIK